MASSFMKLSKIFLKYVVLILYGSGILWFYFKGKPFARGFYCHDNSINQPFRERTVSFTAVLFISFVVALICFLIVEYLKTGENIKQYDLKSIIRNRTFVTRVFVLCVLLLNATVVTVFITDIGKYTVGRLRPNYLSICEPDWSKINCTTVHGLQKAIYGDDHCMTLNLKKLKGARLSFPSGHASFSSKHNFKFRFNLKWEFKEDELNFRLFIIFHIILFIILLYIILSIILAIVAKFRF